MVYVVAGPDGTNIMFETKKEADVYVEAANKAQKTYDENPATHTKVDEALDAWAQKANNLHSKWTDPQVRQDLMQELASIKSRGDKGFMLTDPSSRFNVVFKDFGKEYCRAPTDSTKYYYKNGKKMPLNKPLRGKTDKGEDTRSVDSLWLEVDSPMKAIILMEHGGFELNTVDNIADWYNDEMANTPKIREAYGQAISLALHNVKSSSKILNILTEVQKFGLTGYMGIMDKPIEDFFNMGPNRCTYYMAKAMESDMPNKGDLLVLIANYQPRLEYPEKVSGGFTDGYRARDGLGALIIQKDDGPELVQQKITALTSLSNKGYPSAQKQLAEYYAEQGDYKKADLQLRRLENNEFSGEKMQDLAAEKRKMLKSQTKPDNSLRDKLEALNTKNAKPRVATRSGQYGD